MAVPATPLKLVLPFAGRGKIVTDCGGPGTLSFALTPPTPAELIPLTGSTALMTATPKLRAVARPFCGPPLTIDTTEGWSDDQVTCAVTSVWVPSGLTRKALICFVVPTSMKLLAGDTRIAGL